MPARLLVFDVTVQGHRGHTELGGEAAQADGLEALGIAQLEGSLDDRLPRQAS
jgi:hypothetical protein